MMFSHDYLSAFEAIDLSRNNNLATDKNKATSSVALRV